MDSIKKRQAMRSYGNTYLILSLHHLMLRSRRLWTGTIKIIQLPEIDVLIINAFIPLKSLQ